MKKRKNTKAYVNWKDVTDNYRSYEGSPLDTFNKAQSTVNKERGATYGHPSENFYRIAHLRQVTRECADSRIRVVLDELCTKMARLIESPYHLDSWIDVAGYARTAVMVIQRQDGYPDNPEKDEND